MTTLERTIDYGEHQIAFEVKFSDRKTLDISVHPNLKVIVKAPTGIAIEKIDNRVKHRARWIIKQQDYFQQFASKYPEHQYVDGETHPYLGRRYRLKIEEHPQSKVKLQRGYLQIQTPKPTDSESIRQLLENWYLERAHFKFKERLDLCLRQFPQGEIERPQLQIRRLCKRWGSYTPTGQMILNRDLICAPSPCIDYVITHELCHQKHPNHSKDFYDFLTQVMPDWGNRKQRLEEMLVSPKDSLI